LPLLILKPARNRSPLCGLYHRESDGETRGSRNTIKQDLTLVLWSLKILSRYKERYSFKLYHYVLMTNHVHLILETVAGGGTLADIMKGINLSYAQYYKAKYGHIGHFWQDRYKSILVSKDRYLLACGSYVELNPVRARISQDPKDYRWSSYHGYAFAKRDPVLDEQPIYQELSPEEKGRRKAYREFVCGMLLSRDGMRGEMAGRIIYGNSAFLQRTKAVLGIEERVRARGRPKKDEK